MQRDRRLGAGLAVEFSRERNLEQHVFHHVTAIRPLERERPAAETDVVKPPGLRRQHARIAHLAGLRHQCQPRARSNWASCSGWARSEEHTSELQSLMRISYAVFCLKKKHTHTRNITIQDVISVNTM